MTTKELTREMVLVEIIAERDGIILTQHEQLENLKKEVAALIAENKAKNEEIKKLQEA